MKKFVFISNSSKPSEKKYNSRDKIYLSNVNRPSIESAIDMGYEVYLGVNRARAEELECELDINLFDAHTYRNIFDIKSISIAYKNMMDILKSGNVEVIHCNTPIGGFIGRICGKKAKVSKVIYTAHGFHFYKGAPIINRTVLKWIEMYLARYTDVLITMNEEDYEAAQKFNLRRNGNVYYIPGVGVDTEMYRPNNINYNKVRNSLGLLSDDIILIAMGDLVDRKNYTTAIKAVARANNKSLHFLICGKGPKLKSLRELTKQLGVEQQVHFLGFRTDITELLQIADIFFFTTYQEGLPRSMMEAMSAGLPCIASKIRGNVDLIQDGIGGFLRNPNDLEGFTQAINILVSEKNLREKMKINNLNTIKKFDVENVKKEMEKILKKELTY